MKVNIPIPQSQLIISHGEYGFQEVLNDFNNTNEIIILTYNISTNSNTLLNLIKNLNPNVKVTMVSNIPTRYDTYYSSSNKTTPKMKAKKDISKYFSTMKKENFSPDFAPYFNFNNHIKLVLTDNIAYIGSQNFSDESINNFEMGVLIQDKNTIQNIKDTICKVIINDSTAYGGTELDDYLLRIYILRNKLCDVREIVENIVEKINVYEENSHESYDDIADFDLDKQDLDNIISIIMDLKLIQHEFKEKQFYKLIDTEIIELSELENIELIDDNLIKFFNFNEIEKRKELFKRFFQLSSGDEIREYINNPTFEGWSLLSIEDMKTVDLLSTMVLPQKTCLYKSCFEAFKDLNIKLEEFEVLYLKFETILERLNEIKDKENCIDNTKD